MENSVERRAARRFSMLLPLKVRFSASEGVIEKQGETRDVSFRGLYFTDRGERRNRQLDRIRAHPAAADHAGGRRSHPLLRACPCASNRTTGGAAWRRASSATSSFPQPPREPAPRMLPNLAGLYPLCRGARFIIRLNAEDTERAGSTRRIGEASPRPLKCSVLSVLSTPARRFSITRCAQFGRTAHPQNFLLLSFPLKQDS